MEKSKLNKMHDFLLDLYKKKDVDGLESAIRNYPTYALKAKCYIDRIKNKSNNR